MKILHVVPTYLPAYRYGGPIHAVHNLNKWLVRAGAKVEVYTTAIDGPHNLNVPFDRPVDLDGVRVHYFKPGRFRGWSYAPDMRRALAERASEFDIIHVSSVFLAASTLAANAARQANVPFLISPHGSLMSAALRRRALKKSIYLRFLEKRNLEATDAIHFASEIEKEEYDALGYRMRKAVIIPNGLDPESLPPGNPIALRKKFGISEEKRIILYLGRLSWSKGLDTLAKAFVMVARELPDVVLVLAGGDDEGYKPTLERILEEAGVRQKTILTGALEGLERSAAYQAAEVFALASSTESFAMTVAEAMHFGLPVAVSDRVGLASQVKRVAAGLVAPEDTRQFAAALVELLRDPLGAKEMGARGRKFVTQELDCRKIAGEFLEAYNEIIQCRLPLSS